MTKTILNSNFAIRALLILWAIGIMYTVSCK
jgi:hypothetical protein